MALPLYPGDAQIKARLSAEQVVAMTIRGEAGAELVEGQVAVGSVIRNRLLRPKRFGDTWQKVCLAKWQFSCWIPQGGEANYRALLQRCALALDGVVPWPEQELWVARGIISGALADRVARADHYYASWMKTPPLWAAGHQPVAVVGVHRFYQLP